MRLLVNRNLSGLVCAGVLALVGCEAPPNSTIVPITLQQTPAQHASSAGAPQGPGPQLAYGAPPYPYGYPGNSSRTTFPYTSLAFFVGVPVSVTPSNVGPSITGCSISPSLPAGLSLSSQDCSVSGTPNATSAMTFYTVAADSATGSTATVITLSVNPSAKVINLPQASYLFTQSSPIPTVSIQLGGGAVAADCHAPSGLPPGVTLRADCTIQGTSSGFGATTVQFNGTAGELVFGGSVVPPADAPGILLGSNFQFPITVLGPGQPGITYGGKLFGQAMLQAGTAIYPIVPSSIGATVTSCSVTPALPSGLTLSQTDCSISGTPTVPVEPTLYQITPKSGSSAGNTLPLTLTVEPAQVKALSCQTGTLCVHSLMPVWSQSDPAMVTYVNAHGYSVSSDPGWCGGFSSAMVLSTYFQEIATYSSYQSTAYPAPFAANQDEYTFTFNSMNLVQTDIQNGGTGMPSNTLNPFLGSCGASTDFYFPGDQYALSEFNNTSNYAHGMPLGWISINNTSGPGHAIALNGVEGSYFKIFDPWGSVYNATITHAADGSAGTISFVSGNSNNDVSFYDSGTTSIFDVQWIKDYVFVSGAAQAPYRCQ